MIRLVVAFFLPLQRYAYDYHKHERTWLDCSMQAQTIQRREATWAAVVATGDLTNPIAAWMTSRAAAV